MLLTLAKQSANQFRELYLYREVLASFIGLLFKLKYRRTFLGYVWSLLNPILQLTVLSVVFSHLVRQGVTNYTLYLFAGLLPWNYFFNSLTFSSMCFIESEHYLKKVYLPKILFPVARVTLAFFDFVWALTAFTIIGLFLKFYPNVAWTALPLALFLLTVFCVGAGTLISVLTVFFRDVQYLVTVFLQMLYFLTPIIYPIDMLPPHLRQIITMFNPVLWEIKLFQRILYEATFPTWEEWAIAAAISFGVFALGIITLTVADDEIVFRL